jgi:hypothetical protein
MIGGAMVYAWGRTIGPIMMSIGFFAALMNLRGPVKPYW